MSFKGLTLKKAYSSDEDDILYDFYIPVLKEAKRYDRLAGFFSSTTLAISAKGLVHFLVNKGKMRLVASPRLNRKDIDIIVKSKENPDDYIEAILLKELDKCEIDIINDHVKALGWMLSNDLLQIRIALVYDDQGVMLNAEQIEKNGLFHQKVGIFYDESDNVITFSGSINESATGWLDNIEEFKVFSNWDESSYEYVQSDINKFNRIWNRESQRIKIIDIPSAVKRRLLDIAPENLNQINWEKYYKQKKRIKLFKYQKDAVNSWLDNGKLGLFEMATGTGKTFTALACYDTLMYQCSKLVTIIAAPKNHLVQQWKKEMDSFGIDTDYLIADGTQRGWPEELYVRISDVKMGYTPNLTVFTTHSTFSNKKFTDIIAHFIDEIDMFLIADEVHGVGAEKSQLGLEINYKYRLGLSATPKRWFDLEGTQKIYSYFGGDPIFKYSLEKAIYESTNPDTGLSYLTPYNYHVKFAELTDEEIYEYIELTSKILKGKWVKDEDKQKIIEQLIYQRADIIKDAEGKYEQLNTILDEIQDLRWTIIYCSPKQIETVMAMLQQRNIFFHTFTMEEGTTPSSKFKGISEREYILNLFAKGKYQVLVAMKCLDEGVDVPQARNAIFMSSGGNPREYIQRIGRVIRRYPDKNEANIYDIIIKSSMRKLSEMLREYEVIIVNKQLERCKDIAKIALNSVDAIEKINQSINQIRR